jgi:hypothetical protein
MTISLLALFFEPCEQTHEGFTALCKLIYHQFRANAHISLRFRARARGQREHLQQIMVIPACLEALSPSAAFGRGFLGQQIERQMTNDG